MNLLNKTYCCIAAALMLCSTVAYGQDKNLPKDLYIAGTIPDSLKQDADAVIRYESSEITVFGPGKMSSKYHRINTLLNEKAERYAGLALGYNKFNSIGAMQLMVYDATGKLIKKYSKSDAYDQSATDDGTIVSDDRMKSMGHSVASYPITIEQVYEINTNSYLDLPTWSLQRPKVAVQHASYKVSVSPEFQFRYKNKNTSIQPQKQNNGKNDIYTWQVDNLKAVTPEEDVPDWRVMPKVLFAVNKFEFNGLPGDFTSWQNYGKWIQGLNADVCTLNPKRAAEIKQMVAHLKTDKEKASFLYNYLQRNMRYVSIQLGIGGLKPFPADFVDQKKYGDCKALSNYMYALLKAADIPSYYALVRAGANEEPAEADFPADPFNHIILCVPFKGDTTWLECTSNTQPFGKLGNFTENRNALLITEDGGKLVNTPKSTDADNQFNSNVHLVLDADGGAKAQVKIQSTGEYRSFFVSEFPTVSRDKQKQYLIRAYNFKQPSAFDFKDAADSAGLKEIDLDLEYDTFYDVVAGNKRFLRPRVFDIWSATMPPAEKRHGDYYFEHPMQKTCTTVIDLPAGFEVELLPANVNLKFSYGTYEANYRYDAGKNNHVIPAAKYAEMQQYMDNINKAQNKKLIIHRKA
jgi:hypothetical protein